MSDTPPSPSLFSYSAAKSGASSSVAYDADSGYSLTKTSTDSGGAAVFRGKAVPASAPWSAVMRLEKSPTATADHARFGLALHESSTGKLLIVGLADEAGVRRLSIGSYSSLSSFDAEPYGQPILGTLPEWFRVDFDGANYVAQVSYDNTLTWAPLLTAAAESYFTADKIGVAIHTTNATTLPPTLLVRSYKDPDFSGASDLIVTALGPIGQTVSGSVSPAGTIRSALDRVRQEVAGAVDNPRPAIPVVQCVVIIRG